MWLFKKLACLSILLALCQCSSFQPLYSSYEGVAIERLSQIKISTIEGRLGQEMHNALLQKLTPSGVPEKPQYVLDLETSFVDRDLGVAKDATTTRNEITLTVRYTLRNAHSGETVLKGTEQESADYNMLTHSYYSNVVSKDSTREGLIEMVSDLIKLALASHLSQKAGG